MNIFQPVKKFHRTTTIEKADAQKLLLTGCLLPRLCKNAEPKVAVGQQQKIKVIHRF